MTDNQAAGSLPLPSLSVSHITDLGQLGEYRLVEKLGEGGMGVVYKAVHTELDRVVAVKVLPAGRLRDEESIARFHREIKAIGRLDHPHIVRAYDARRIGETHFLVMEFVEGPDWEHLVRHLGPLRVADVCELGRQAAVGAAARARAWFDSSRHQAVEPDADSRRPSQDPRPGAGSDSRWCGSPKH